MSDLDVFKKLFYGMPSLPALPEFYFSLANLGLKIHISALARDA